MMEYNGNNRKLRVKDSFKELIGRDIASIEPKIKKKLKPRKNNIIEINNAKKSKKSAAFVYSGRFENKNSDIIRLDFFQEEILYFSFIIIEIIFNQILSD